MIQHLKVQNFKSITSIEISPGAVNVIIGENGCGKTNLLEALVFAGAAAADKLDNEFLASRGVRVTEPGFMVAAFDPGVNSGWLEVHQTEGWSRGTSFVRVLRQGTWFLERGTSWSRIPPELAAVAAELLKSLPAASFSPSAFAEFQRLNELNPMTAFLLYAPENSALRTFAAETQILPLGIKGEGLFKLLYTLSKDADRWAELKANLAMLDWFEDIELRTDLAPFERAINIRDRFIASELQWFDQRSANEGFLFLLFYLALMISPQTPTIFAVDNVDTGLNPKLASALMTRIAELAKKYGKQVFLTTHSPAVLDGLDLTDDQQRLWVMSRSRKGDSRIRRVDPPSPVAGEAPLRLSEAFIRGLLGGIPKHF